MNNPGLVKIRTFYQTFFCQDNALQLTLTPSDYWADELKCLELLITNPGTSVNADGNVV